MNSICLITIWYLTTIQAEQAGETVRLFAEPGSKVSVSGAMTLHDWEVSGSDIGGWIEFASDAFDHSAKTPPAGRAVVRCEIAIPVRSLRINDGLTKSLHHFLKEESYPQITFRFEEGQMQTNRAGRETHYRLNARGPMAVAGVTNFLSIPIEVIPLGGRRFRLTGTTRLKMSSHSIEPPVLQTSGGAVRYRDDVEVSFEWIVGPKGQGGRRD